MAIQALQHSLAIKFSRAILSKIGGSGVLLLFGWPWLLLAINRSLFFLNGTFVDGWIYFGLFRNLPEYIKIYESAGSSYQAGANHFYYDDRLTWILPGYLIYHIFPPIIANYLLHFAVYYIIVFALYATLTLTIHRRVALLAALLMGSYSYFLLAVGWDYVDGSGLVYFSLTLLLLTLAARATHRAFWLGSAGAAAAALFFSNIFWAALMPCVGLYYVLINRQRSAKTIASGLVPLAIGALSLTLVVGFINVVLGGPFFFFASSLAFASSVSRLQTNPWIQTSLDWPITNPHLIWPLIILLACGSLLSISRIRRRYDTYPQSRIFIIVYLFMALIMVALQIRGSTPVLQAFFYVSYLIPALFLAIGVVLTPLVTGLSNTRFLALISITLFASLCSFAFKVCGQAPLYNYSLPAIILGIAWLFLLICFPTRIWIYGVFVLAFYFVTPSVFGIYATESFCGLNRSQHQPENDYLSVIDGMDAIEQIAPGKRVYFWFDQNEQPIYSALSSTHLYSWNLISLNFPSISGNGSYPEFAPPAGTIIAVLSQQADALAQAQATLLERNRTIRLLGQRTIRQGAGQFNLYIFDTQAIPPRVALSQKIDFSQKRFTELFLTDGWSGPEQFGAWTNGARAELKLSIPHPAHRSITMTVDIANTIGAFVPHPPNITVNILANGIRLDTWKFDAARQWGIYTVTIPDEVLAISDTTQIAFDIIDPHSPKDLGFDPNDTRQLGIAVRSIRFDALNFWDAQSEMLGTAPPSGVRVGRAEADGWAASPDRDHEGFLQYGPYTPTLPPGNYSATWALMIDDATADDLPIVRLEVVDSSAGEKILTSRVLTRKQWRSANQYQSFSVPFALDNAAASHPLEFRVYWYDRAYVREQNVSIK